MELEQNNISLIACISSNYGIGLNNELLYKIPNDMKRFKELTTGKCVVMGMGTYDSIVRFLPNRKNILVTHDIDAITHMSARPTQPIICLGKSMPFPGSLKLFKDEEEIFIIGGEQIYYQTINLASKMYLTIVEDNKLADRRFPIFTEKDWKIVFEEEHFFFEEGKPPLKYKFVNFERF